MVRKEVWLLRLRRSGYCRDIGFFCKPEEVVASGRRPMPRLLDAQPVSKMMPACLCVRLGYLGIIQQDLKRHRVLDTMRHGRTVCICTQLVWDWNG